MCRAVSASNTHPARDERDQSQLVVAERLAGGAVCSCEFAVEPGPAGDIVVLRVAGEIDMVTLPGFRDALTAAADRHPVDLVVDLGGVGFCCVRGFALLDAAVRTAQSRGTGCSLSGLTRHLDRVANLLWCDQRCVRYRSVAAAVHAIRVDHTYRLI
jgi:anti-sigma B factor antagonist